MRTLFCSKCKTHHSISNFYGIGDQLGREREVVGHLMNCKTCVTTILFLKEKNKDYEQVMSQIEIRLRVMAGVYVTSVLGVAMNKFEQVDNLKNELKQLREDLKEANPTEAETIKELIRLREESLENVFNH